MVRSVRDAVQRRRRLSVVHGGDLREQRRLGRPASGELLRADPVVSGERALNPGEASWIYFLYGTRPPFFNPVTLDHPGLEARLTLEVGIRDEYTMLDSLDIVPVVEGLIFADGFESGSSSAWSTTVP